MKRTRAFLIAAVVASAWAAGCASQPQPAPIDPSNLGYLEHRGQRHELRDLMDPEYRAASDDPFVNNFNADTNMATRHNWDKLRIRRPLR